MRNLENKDKLDRKRTSYISQALSGFSGRIKDIFNKPPERIEAFGREWRLDKCESPDRVQEITEGKNKYLKITVKPGDKKEWKRKALQRGTERAEIQQKEKINYDEEHIQNFTFQIPKDFTLCPRRTVICQWKRSPELTGDDAPLLSLRIKKIDGKYYLILTDGYRDELVPKDNDGNKLRPYVPIDDNIIGKDVNIECKTLFSDKGESKVSVKLGGETMYDGPISIPHPKKDNSEKTQVYFKFGIYRDCYKHAIRKIKKDKNLTEKQKKLQIKEIKEAKNKEREKDSYILLKDYNIKKSEGNELFHNPTQNIS